MRIKYLNEDRNVLRAMTHCLMTYIERKDKESPFYLALSGGETAKKLFTLWVEEYRDKITWERIHFFWVDERCVLPSDPESNYGWADQLLFSPLGIAATQVHRIHGEREPGTEAMRYSRVIKEFLPRHGMLPYFDCILLGIGTDGHIASIFPDSLSLLTDTRSYAVSQPSGAKHFRITMTGRLITNGSPLLIPLLGQQKKEILKQIKKGYSVTNPLPATYILSQAVEATLFCGFDKE